MITTFYQCKVCGGMPEFYISEGRFIGNCQKCFQKVSSDDPLEAFEEWNKANKRGGKI